MGTKECESMRPRLLFAALAAVLVALHPRPALSHCDTVEGPVVRDARTALETRDVAPVLKWVAAVGTQIVVGLIVAAAQRLERIIG